MGEIRSQAPGRPPACSADGGLATRTSQRDARSGMSAWNVSRPPTSRGQGSGRRPVASWRASSLEGLALRGPYRQAATHLFGCTGCSGVAKRGAGGTQKAKQKEGRKKERKTLGNISVLIAASDSGLFTSGAILGGLPHTDCKMHTRRTV